MNIPVLNAWRRLQQGQPVAPVRIVDPEALPSQIARRADASTIVTVLENAPGNESVKITFARIFRRSISWVHLVGSIPLIVAALVWIESIRKYNYPDYDTLMIIGAVGLVIACTIWYYSDELRIALMFRRSTLAKTASAIWLFDLLRYVRPETIEASFLAKTLRTAHEITATSAWSSEQLDRHNLRVDLPTEVRALTLRCMRIAHARTDLGRRPVSEQAALLHDSATANLDAIAGRIEVRINALSSYRSHLQLISDELMALSEVESMERRVDRVNDLIVTMGDDQIGADEIERLNADVSATAAGLTHAIRSIRTDLAVLNTSLAPTG